MVFVYRASAVASKKALSDYAEGDLIKLNEGGAPVEFYVAKHDYEPDLNGTGRTLVVRKDVYEDRVWDSGNVNAYSGSDLDTWFNGTYKNLLDPTIQNAIGTTKFYYTPMNGNTTVDTLERSIFALSIGELGLASSYVNTEGSVLPIASALLTVYKDGVATKQWTRTPYKSTTTNVCLITETNSSNYAHGFSRYDYGARPIFTLPSTTLFSIYTNEVVS